MRALLGIVALVLRTEHRALLRGFALAVTVLAMGAALLGLSGWFIVAAAASGLAGTGALFNVFGPSSMVRFLALGRTAARYGERLLTHDATLRALSGLRVRLLRGFLAQPWRVLERLRANAVLNRVTADVDALDGVLLRLVIPAVAGGLVLLGAGALLAWLVHPWVGLWVSGGWLLAPTAAFALGQRRARAPARRVEAAGQAMRARMVDLIAAREDLLTYGQLDRQTASVAQATAREADARRALERVERRAGFALDLIGTVVVGGALAIGGGLAQRGDVTPAQAALGVLAALALAEATTPVRRALAEVGRMAQAARRIVPALDPAFDTARSPTQDPTQDPIQPPPPKAPLRLDAVTTGRFAPVTLEVRAGETVALTGPSGRGKSTVLLMAAGVLAPAQGRVTLGGQTPATEADWRRAVVMVPQRHALIAGTLRENLALAGAEAEDDARRAALEAVQLTEVVKAKGGLDATLGFRGAGLSGGESRRLALARAILTRPRVLLLDEPTEGLDHETAAKVMTGLRNALPETAMLVAAHRSEDRKGATCVIALQGLPVAVRKTDI
ncbi:amino acid ABC transporter ATP-binding/permease protein [Sagittula salina]|uniref:ATP-binding cassette domain-containing protein n=1 Tax=Sagittula salina TaxID=2820268 RepID=A0A940MQ34_9RHOB|nr:ATP-binding cassette domain-containing protein [Sagittula salina]MBP0482686.1 ATP-binding cassette domain-containing protein [Sagittula salina]